jgi:hypothetical protein
MQKRESLHVFLDSCFLTVDGNKHRFSNVFCGLFIRDHSVSRNKQMRLSTDNLRLRLRGSGRYIDRH